MIRGQEQSVIDWLETLVAMDTRNGTGDELACLQFLAKSLKSFNPDHLILDKVARSRGKTDSGYVLAIWGKPQILLNVHIDTVPDGKGWSGDPFSLRRLGDKYIGLGTSDIKGAVACILSALNHVQPTDCAILFSGDEEHGSEVMPEAIKRGHVSDAPNAIICEPTGCKIGRRHRGILAFSIQCEGPGGHSSLADNVPAPLLQISQLASALGAYGIKHKDFGAAPYKGLCMNIGEVQTDGSYNVIPTQARLKFSLRPPPGDHIGQREAEILEMCQPFEAHISTLDRLVSLEPFESDNVTAFQPYFQSDYDPVDLPYWTEAALLAQSGKNCIVYGPGDLEQAHKPDEYVRRGQLETATALYAKVLSGGMS